MADGVAVEPGESWKLEARGSRFEVRGSSRWSAERPRGTTGISINSDSHHSLFPIPRVCAALALFLNGLPRGGAGTSQVPSGCVRPTEGRNSLFFFQFLGPELPRSLWVRKLERRSTSAVDRRLRARCA